MLVKKILFSVFGASMLFFLVMGPQLGKVSQKASYTTSGDTTAQTAYTSGSGSNIKVPTTGSTSTYDVPSIKLPDGSELKLPSYTPTASTSSSSHSSGTTSVTGPDASVCASAQAAMSQIMNAYDNKSLQVQISNYQDFITNNSKTYAARGYGPSTDEKATDQRVLVALQNAQNQLSSNMQKMNQQLVPYQQQIVANQCNQ